MASYVHGNVVHKDSVVVQSPVKHKEVSQRVQANRSKAMHMSKGYVAFLAIAAIVVLFVCMRYLQLQSEISSRANHITALQQELADTKEANTTRYNAVMNSMNLEEIRNIAINEFGMVNATPEQIIMYKSPTGSMITKYADIPESGILASSDVMN